MLRFTSIGMNYMWMIIDKWNGCKAKFWHRKQNTTLFRGRVRKKWSQRIKQNKKQALILDRWPSITGNGSSLANDWTHKIELWVIIWFFLFVCLSYCYSFAAAMAERSRAESSFIFFICLFVAWTVFVYNIKLSIRNSRISPDIMSNVYISVQKQLLIYIAWHILI